MLEETGVERYVHLRSVDDEYEHLESTLPSRARNGNGGAAGGGVGGSPPAEGVEGGPGEGEDVGDGDGDTVVGGGGGDGDGRSAAGEGPAAAQQESNHRGEEGRGGGDGRGTLDGGSERNNSHSGAQSESPRPQQRQQPEHRAPSSSSSSSSAPPVPLEQRIELPYQEGDEGLDAGLDAALPRRDPARSGGSPAGPSLVEVPSDDAETAENAENAAPAVADPRRCPSSPPPSAYHYRSPSCSPRLSPRPKRSPYRQEGVGGRESSGRGEVPRKSGEERKRREELETPPCSSPGEGDSSEGAARRGRRQPGGVTHAAAEGKCSGLVGESGGAKACQGEDKKGHERGQEGDARVLRSSSGSSSSCSPMLSGPVPVPSRGDGDSRVASPQGGGDVGIQAEDAALSDTEEGSRKPSATRLDGSEGALTRGGGLEGAESDEPGGFTDGHEGSVVFIDNQGREGGDGQTNSSAHAEEGWWHHQPESGSVLRGVDFAFDKGDDVVPAVHATAGEDEV